MVLTAWKGPSDTGVGATLAGSGLHVDERPKSWERLIHKQYMNGTAPMLALLNGSRKEAVSDPEFNWWTKQILPTSEPLTLDSDGVSQGSGVYTNAGLTAATLYTSAAAAGTPLHLRVLDTTNIVLNQFRAQDEVLLRNESYPARDCVAKVTNVTPTSHSLEVILLQADPNTSGSTSWNRVRLIGQIMPELATAPKAVSLKPTKYYNLIQEFQEPVSISDTLLQTELRTTNDLRLDRKADALDMHMMKIEQALIFGYRYEAVSPVNNEPERAMMGMVPFLKANGGLTGGFPSASAYGGQTWLEGGWPWIREQLAVIFKFGGPERLAFCGTGTMNAIEELAAYHGTISLDVGQTTFGMAVARWVSVFGTILFKTHPLFSHDPTDSKSMLVFDPANVRYVHLKNRDTHYISDNSMMEGGSTSVDGIVEFWKTKCSAKFYHPNEWAYLTGFGDPNVLAPVA